MVERQARDLEVRGSNPGPGSNFSLELKFKMMDNCSCIVTVLIELAHKNAVHVAMGCSQKSFKLVWRCHQLLSGFLAEGHLPQMSRQSRCSLMIRVIMKRSWGLCRDLLIFALLTNSIAYGNRRFNVTFTRALQ